MPDNNPSLVARLVFVVRFLFHRLWRFITLNDVQNAEKMAELSGFDGLRATLLPFKGQRWYHQLLIFTVGTGIWITTYVGIMYWFGWVEYATKDTPEAIAHRRHAATWALAVSVTYYAIMGLV